MGCQVNLSSPLWKYSNNIGEFEIDGKTIREIITGLENEVPDLKVILSGSLKNAVKIYLNNNDIELLDNMETAVNEGDEIFLSPVLTGG